MAFIDPSKRRQTIADHVDFCRGFLKIFGCTHFKINMGSRPQNGTTVDDIKAIAETVLELGQRTLEMGVTIAPHPHIWGPIERPEEVRALLDQTDPDIVSWIPDTGHQPGRRRSATADRPLLRPTGRCSLEGLEGIVSRLSGPNTDERDARRGNPIQRFGIRYLDHAE